LHSLVMVLAKDWYLTNKVIQN